MYITDAELAEMRRQHRENITAEAARIQIPVWPVTRPAGNAPPLRELLDRLTNRPAAA